MDTSTPSMQRLRKGFGEDRILFGKNRVMAKGLELHLSSKDAEEKNSLLKKMSHGVCLLFTEKESAAVKSIIEDTIEKTYFSAGAVAKESIQIPAGPVFRKEVPFLPASEPKLREYGLKSVVLDGAVVIKKDAVLTTEGGVVSIKQAKLLRLLGIKAAEGGTEIVRYSEGGAIFAEE